MFGVAFLVSLLARGYSLQHKPDGSPKTLAEEREENKAAKVERERV
jgi:hypothetical protein